MPAVLLSAPGSHARPRRATVTALFAGLAAMTLAVIQPGAPRAATAGDRQSHGTLVFR